MWVCLFGRERSGEGTDGGSPLSEGHGGRLQGDALGEEQQKNLGGGVSMGGRAAGGLLAVRGLGRVHVFVPAAVSATASGTAVRRTWVAGAVSEEVGRRVRTESGQRRRAK